MCGMSSLPDILFTGVSRFVVMVSPRFPTQTITCSRNPWALYWIPIELWFVCGMSSLPDILWTVVSWYVATVIGVSLLVKWVTFIAIIVD